MGGRGQAKLDELRESGGLHGEQLWRDDNTSRLQEGQQTALEGIQNVRDQHDHPTNRNVMALANIMDRSDQYTRSDGAGRQSQDIMPARSPSRPPHLAQRNADLSSSQPGMSIGVGRSSGGSWDRDIPAYRPSEAARASRPTDAPSRKRTSLETSRYTSPRTIKRGAMSGGHPQRLSLATSADKITDHYGRSSMPRTDQAESLSTGLPPHPSSSLAEHHQKAASPLRRPQLGLVGQTSLSSESSTNSERPGGSRQTGRRPRVWLDENALAVPPDLHPDLVIAYRMGIQAAIRAIEQGTMSVRDREYVRPMVIISRAHSGGGTTPSPSHVAASMGAQPWTAILNTFSAVETAYPPSSVAGELYHPPYSASAVHAKEGSHHLDRSAPTFQSRFASYGHTQLTVPGTKLHPVRQEISCYPCRKRKSRCDGMSPCGQCSKRGSGDECHYAAYIRRRGKASKQDGEDGMDGMDGIDGVTASDEEGVQDGEDGEIGEEDVKPDIHGDHVERPHEMKYRAL